MRPTIYRLNISSTLKLSSSDIAKYLEKYKSEGKYAYIIIDGVEMNNYNYSTWQDILEDYYSRKNQRSVELMYKKYNELDKIKKSKNVEMIKDYYDYYNDNNHNKKER